MRRDSSAKDSAPDWDALFGVAQAQMGYFTTRQAATAGYSPQLLYKYLENGKATRVRRGVYRLVHFPASQIDFVLDGPSGVTAIEVTASSRLKPAKIERLTTAARELGADRTLLIHGGFLEEEAEGISAVSLQRFLLDPVGRLFAERGAGGRK